MWPWADHGWNFPGTGKPHPADDGDVRLTYEVADALLADDQTRRQRITVQVQNGVVLLSGTVHDQHTAEMVTAVVRHVSGVRDVRNSLRTRVTGAPEAGNSALAMGGRRESDAFDEIVAALSSREASHPRAKPKRRLPGQAKVFLVAVVLLLLGWLVMKLGWPGVLIACVVGAVAVEMNLRRRRNPRR